MIEMSIRTTLNRPVFCHRFQSLGKNPPKTLPVKPAMWDKVLRRQYGGLFGQQSARLEIRIAETSPPAPNQQDFHLAQSSNSEWQKAAIGRSFWYCPARTATKLRIPVPDMESGKQPAANASIPGGQERRRHTRHQFIERVFIITPDGEPHIATSFEVSEGGMSAASTTAMHVGDKVGLRPVTGETVKAVVRRNQGTMYGFEFLELAEGIRLRLRALCQNLPPFRTSANI
jgi:PilZ domain